MAPPPADRGARRDAPAGQAARRDAPAGRGARGGPGGGAGGAAPAPALPDADPPLPPPRDLGAGPRILVPELAGHVGEDDLVEWCAGLLGGHVRDLRPDWLHYLGGRAWSLAWRDPGTPWPRIWALRAFRYVWRPSAAGPVVAAVTDPAWRVAELATHVVGLRDLPEAADGVAQLSGHRLPRVRAASVRTLGLVGDTEHVPVVARSLSDPHPLVRDAAQRATRRLASRLDIDPSRWSA